MKQPFNNAGKPIAGVYKEHRFTWHGIHVVVRHCPNWSEAHAAIYGWPLAHLEIRAGKHGNTPLPITGTGYYSRFLPESEVKAAGGALNLVNTWLNQAILNKNTLPSSPASPQQLSLFG